MATEKFYVTGYDIAFPNRNKRAGKKKALKRLAHSKHRMRVKNALRRGEDGTGLRPLQTVRS